MIAWNKYVREITNFHQVGQGTICCSDTGLVTQTVTLIADFLYKKAVDRQHTWFVIRMWYLRITICLCISSNMYDPHDSNKIECIIVWNLIGSIDKYALNWRKETFSFRLISKASNAYDIYDCNTPYTSTIHPISLLCIICHFINTVWSYSCKSTKQHLLPVPMSSTIIWWA